MWCWMDGVVVWLKVESEQFFSFTIALSLICKQLHRGQLMKNFPEGQVESIYLSTRSHYWNFSQVEMGTHCPTL